MTEPVLDRDRFVLGDASQHVGFLNCERISERSHIHGWRVEPHYHEGLAQIFFFWNKQVIGQIDFEEVAIQPPAMVWMPPLINHGFDYPEDICGWVVTVPSVNLTQLTATMPWTNSWILNPAIVCGNDLYGDLSSVRSLFQSIEAEHAQWGEERNAVLEALFRIVLVALHRIMRAPHEKNPVRNSHRSLVAQFQSLVDRDYVHKRSVSTYAAELSVTSTYLTRCLRSVTSRTAGEIIHDRLLLEARRLLVFTDLPIAEIAYHLNFSTPSYFTRFFTHLTNEKPTAFRIRMRSGREPNT